MYRLEISNHAERDMDRLSPEIFDRIVPVIQSLSRNPRPHGSLKLAGTKSDYRIRVGDYRVLYEIADQVRIVRVLRVRHRREAYR
jgi:mRNA interferase RelE/StbE